MVERIEDARNRIAYELGYDGEWTDADAREGEKRLDTVYECLTGAPAPSWARADLATVGRDLAKEARFLIGNLKPERRSGLSPTRTAVEHEGAGFLVARSRESHLFDLVATYDEERLGARLSVLVEGRSPQAPALIRNILDPRASVRLPSDFSLDDRQQVAAHLVRKSFVHELVALDLPTLEVVRRAVIELNVQAHDPVAGARIQTAIVARKIMEHPEKIRDIVRQEMTPRPREEWQGMVHEALSSLDEEDLATFPAGAVDALAELCPTFDSSGLRAGQQALAELRQRGTYTMFAEARGSIQQLRIAAVTVMHGARDEELLGLDAEAFRHLHLCLTAQGRDHLASGERLRRIAVRRFFRDAPLEVRGALAVLEQSLGHRNFALAGASEAQWASLSLSGLTDAVSLLPRCTWKERFDPNFLSALGRKIVAQVLTNNSLDPLDTVLDKTAADEPEARTAIVRAVLAHLPVEGLDALGVSVREGLAAHAQLVGSVDVRARLRNVRNQAVGSGVR